MTFDPKPAVRQNLPLLVLLAGASGSGKTESALMLATGMAGANGRICVIDTERGRALHKADDYTFDHVELDEPFTPERYAEALAKVDELGYAVVILDSGSHEYDGIGGILDAQTEEFARMGRKESMRLASWAEPKKRHRRYVQQLLRMRAHVILAHRAADKVELGKDENGKTVVRPKRALTGADGWVPICEARLPYEATVSLLLTPERPGYPIPVKLEERHRALVPLDRPLTQAVGEKLAAWAAGAAPPSEPTAPAASEPLPGEAAALETLLLAYGRESGRDDEFTGYIASSKAKRTDADHVEWLKRQIETLEHEKEAQPA